MLYIGSIVDSHKRLIHIFIHMVNATSASITGGNTSLSDELISHRNLPSAIQDTGDHL